MMELIKKHQISSLFFGFAALELFSFFSFLHPRAEIILFFLIVAATIAVTLWRTEYGLLIVLAELFIGSKGYLFFLEINSERLISIRLAVFSVVISVWLIKSLKNIFKLGFKKFIGNWKLETGNFLKWYFVVFAVLGVGLIRAFILKNGFSNVFFDINGYLYFALIFPVADILKNEKNWESVFRVAGAAFLWTAAKTFVVFYVFAHNLWLYTPSVYKWIRDTGVGEVTKMTEGFYRVFFQGHIYELLALVILFGTTSWFFAKQNHYEKNKFSILDSRFSKLLTLVIAAVLAAVVIMSFSRSFWVGGGAGILTLFSIMIFVFRIKFFIVGKSVLFMIGAGVVGLVVIFALMNIPPRGLKITNPASLIAERASADEAAGQSRAELLGPLWNGILKHPILGSGFGATITYHSKDPRILQNNPAGEYTTYAFEWGYLDLWYKMGIFGLIAFFGLLIIIFFRAWKIFTNNDRGFWEQAAAVAVFISVLSLAAVHFFTPYLNHPLGIGFVIISSLLVFQIQQKRLCLSKTKLVC